MDKIVKALQKLLPKDRKAIKEILLLIKNNSLSGLDLKKLKNCDNIFRVRVGNLRIIFQKKDNGEYFILTVEKRSDKTYNKY